MLALCVPKADVAAFKEAASALGFQVGGQSADIRFDRRSTTWVVEDGRKAAERPGVEAFFREYQRDSAKGREWAATLEASNRSPGREAARQAGQDGDRAPMPVRTENLVFLPFGAHREQRSDPAVPTPFEAFQAAVKAETGLTPKVIGGRDTTDADALREGVLPLRWSRGMGVEADGTLAPKGKYIAELHPENTGAFVARTADEKILGSLHRIATGHGYAGAEARQTFLENAPSADELALAREEAKARSALPERFTPQEFQSGVILAATMPGIEAEMRRNQTVLRLVHVKEQDGPEKLQQLVDQTAGRANKMFREMLGTQHRAAIVNGITSDPRLENWAAVPVYERQRQFAGKGAVMPDFRGDDAKVYQQLLKGVELAGMIPGIKKPDLAQSQLRAQAGRQQASQQQDAARQPDPAPAPAPAAEPARQRAGRRPAGRGIA